MTTSVETIAIEGFEGVELRSPAGLSATFVPGAGMLGLSLRDDDVELLGQRRGLASYVHDARTMGIPLLYPWANRLDPSPAAPSAAEVEIATDTPGVHLEEHGLPIHGLLAGAPGWQAELPEQSAADPATFAATFDFAEHPELLAAFPYPHALRIAVRLRDRTLTIATTIRASDERAVPLAFGFHPYLVLPDVPRADWHVELPAMTHVTLDERALPTGATTPAPVISGPLAARTYDDGFVDVPDGATFALEGGGRRIEVRFEQGFAAAQVFAPSAEDVVCFEPMAAPTNALRTGDRLPWVAPGEQATATFSISVR